MVIFFIFSKKQNVFGSILQIFQCLQCITLHFSLAHIVIDRDHILVAQWAETQTE